MPVPKAPSTVSSSRTLLRDRVRMTLRDAIIDGTLEPGEALHDKELQEWLGVSRTPLRDAINELARMGLIDMQPNRYTRVANPTDEETTDAMNTLGVIYGGVVRLAIPRLDDEQAKEIAERLRFFRDAIRRKDPVEMRQWGFPTFELYETACGNPLLVKLCRESVDGLTFKVRAQKVLRLYSAAETIEHLNRLMEATLNRDAKAGEEATAGLFQLPPV